MQSTSSFAISRADEHVPDHPKLQKNQNIFKGTPEKFICPTEKTIELSFA